MFIAQTVDVSTSMQYGFIYSLGSTSSTSPTIVFQNRAPTAGSFYRLTSIATFQWTNDNYTNTCGCNMQYVRVYTDYAPSQQDQFISLALMNPDSNCNLILSSNLIELSYYPNKVLCSSFIFKSTQLSITTRPYL